MLILVNCSNDDDAPSNPTNVDIAALLSAVNDGTWRITNFNDSGENETSDFNAYTFTFRNNGILEAVNDVGAESGMWSVTNSGSSSSTDIDLNISFNSPVNQDFLNLSDEWDVVSYTSTKINLRDVSGGRWKYRLIRVY